MVPRMSTGHVRSEYWQRAPAGQGREGIGEGADLGIDDAAEEEAADGDEEGAEEEEHCRQSDCLPGDPRRRRHELANPPNLGDI